MNLKLFVSTLVFATVASTTLMADAIPYPNPGTIAPADSFSAASTGDVIAYYYGSSASDDEQLGLFVNGVQLGNYGLENRSSQFGDVYDFGSVNAGDTLTFALRNLTTGQILYSNPSLNSDGTNHTYTTTATGSGNGNVMIPPGIFVSFEDQLLGHSDFNYRDEGFVLTNVTSNPLSESPEPGSVLLMTIAGFISLGFGLIRKAKI